MTQRETTITIGWTKHKPASDYMPFYDHYRPGQPQHTETITVEVPEPLSAQGLAETVYYALNAPTVAPQTLPGRILAAVQATGYTGREAHWSLSVGDTVTVDGQTLAVAPLGWVPIG